MPIQAFGGTCPCCSYDRMFVRYGNEDSFQFEACPCCGFAFGTWVELEGYKWIPKSGINNEIWEAIEIMEGMTRYQAFQQSQNKNKKDLLLGRSWTYTQQEIAGFKQSLQKEMNPKYDLG